MRFYENNLVDLGWLNLDKQVVRFFYANYLKELDKALSIVKTIDPQFKEGLRPFSIANAEGVKEKIKIIIKLITRFNLFNKTQLLN